MDFFALLQQRTKEQNRRDVTRDQMQNQMTRLAKSNQNGKGARGAIQPGYGSNSKPGTSQSKAAVGSIQLGNGSCDKPGMSVGKAVMGSKQPGVGSCGKPEITQNNMKSVAARKRNKANDKTTVDHEKSDVVQIEDDDEEDEEQEQDHFGLGLGQKIKQTDILEEEQRDDLQDEDQSQGRDTK